MKNAYGKSWLLMGALIVGLAGCANAGTKTGAYVDDSWITTKVKSDMVADKEVSAGNISVKTTRGVVTLTGKASSATEWNKASEIARGVAGVKSVENNIRIE